MLSLNLHSHHNHPHQAAAIAAAAAAAAAAIAGPSYNLLMIGLNCVSAGPVSSAARKADMTRKLYTASKLRSSICRELRVKFSITDLFETIISL